MLVDNHGRTIDYLRLAVTDRCNLRCFYCMPEEGINYVPRDNLLSYEELIRIVKILSYEGVTKVRITGGEPFLRKGLLQFLHELSLIKGINQIAITTNGTLTEPHLDRLYAHGIRKYNLSIDSLDRDRFREITRRDSYDTVISCMNAMLARDIELKLNCVVMKDQNIEDIIPMVELAAERKLSVRFIEEMPFNGAGAHYQELEWNHIRIFNHIKAKYPNISQLPTEKSGTSLNYKIDGFVGDFGIIPAYTRSFCGSCNRLRLTPTGMIKTCLYDDGVFNLRDLIRSGASDAALMTAIQEAIGHRAKDGFEAENRRRNGDVSESMATIGG